MWPPSRSPARSGSSRLTSSPAASGPSDERRKVSAMTSALKRDPSTTVAVRHTPLTATESPTESWGARVSAASVSRTPSASSSTATTSPLAATSPVNISGSPPPPSPLPEAGRDQDVVLDALHLRAQRSHRVVDQLDALGLDRRLGVAPSGDERRHEEPGLIHLACLEEDACQVGAALEEDGLHIAVAELVERTAQTGRLVLARHDDHLDARHAERVGSDSLGRTRADQDHGNVRGAAHQLAVQGQARLGVEDHPAWLASDTLHARGEQGIVHRGRVYADGDGITLRPPAVRACAACLARYPLRVPTARGHLAVERHGRLEDHERPSPPGMFAKRLVEEARGVLDLALDGVHGHALV